ncbi:MAG: DNA repair protein RecN [Kiloniellales bacterium]|nr:DNA repair protein RecN [Kiloniellales bacterium]
MLVSLAIRDVVLIDHLDLIFEDGLCALTGETGAGKSILLDSLGLALGGRADTRLVRHGARQASVTAVFDLDRDHPAAGLLADHGLHGDDDSVLLRRVLGADGRSRAFINDQAVSVGLLRSFGDSLVEIQGQFEQRGLLNSATHRQLVDSYAGAGGLAREVAAAWRAWREAVTARAQAESELDRARSDEAFLRHALEEIDLLAPEPGEAAALAEQRHVLQHGEKVIEAVNGALAELAGDEGAQSGLGAAQSALERVADKAGKSLDPVLDVLARAAAETEEAVARIQSLLADFDLDPRRLEEVEERYFALKDMARKHDVEVDQLLALRTRLAERLAGIDNSAERLEALTAAVEAARATYLARAETLGEKRREAAESLQTAVNGELPPLKLEKAVFLARVERLDETDWGAQGLDRVTFEASTNPGNPPAALNRVASGGELSRFLLALKVVLARVDQGKTLVFDEVDSGIGGATADAVGERLQRLAEDRQILVVTHSPQVAARARHHWCVRKVPDAGQVATRVGRISDEARREEIARMLSGAEITEEARAAADRLMGAA